MRNTLFVFFSFLFFGSCLASGLDLEDLNISQTKKVIEDLNIHLLPTTVTPASSLGRFFGVEAGVIGGYSESPEIDKLDSSNISKLPHAALLLAVHAPYGIGLEYSTLPIKTDNFYYKYHVTGVKWTFTDLWDKFPLDMRIRAQYAKGTLSYEQKVSDIPVDVDYIYSSFATNFTISKKLFFLEPYFLLGYLSSKNDLKATGSATIFDATVTAGDRENISLKYFYLIYGLQLDLGFFHTALELAQAQSRKKVSFKVSFAF